MDDRSLAQEDSGMQRLPDVKLPLRSLILRIIYALCLSGATCNHWRIIYDHGLFWDYGGVPQASATFWTALAFVDPVAVILLSLRANVGIAMTIGIIVVDVIHNVWIQARYFPPFLENLILSPQVIEQIVFMLFVLVSSPFAWAPERHKVK